MPSYVRSTTLRSVPVPVPAVRAFDPARPHTVTPIWSGGEDRRFISPKGQGASATPPRNRLYSRRGSAVVPAHAAAVPA